MNLREIIEGAMRALAFKDYTLEVVDNDFGKKVYSLKFQGKFDEMEIWVHKNFLIRSMQHTRFGTTEFEKIWHLEDDKPVDILKSIMNEVKRLRAL